MTQRYSAYLKDLGEHQPPGLHSVVLASEYDALLALFRKYGQHLGSCAGPGECSCGFARGNDQPHEFAEMLGVPVRCSACGELKGHALHSSPQKVIDHG